MALPLEILDPKKYNTFDIEQIELINNYNAYDLVLIENATELFREVMHDKPGNLEKMLQIIVNDIGSECVYVDSETFPYYVTPQTIREYNLDPDESRATKQEYNAAIRRYKKMHLTAAFKKNPCIITIFAADLVWSGGHYAAYIWHGDDQKLIIFDSMATSHGTSAYYPYFQQLGRDVFGTPKEMGVPRIQNLISLQYTGGFSRNIPSEIPQSVLNNQAQDPQLRRFVKAVTAQSTESQNHFCYMWSIWFIHALLTGYKLEALTATINDNDVNPLFVIKRYSWAMLKLANLESQLSYPDLYNKYFPMVWYNTSPASFAPYKMKMYECDSPKQCFVNSMTDARLTELPVTPVPQIVNETIQNILDKL